MPAAWALARPSAACVAISSSRRVGQRPPLLGQQQRAQRLAVDALHHDVRQAGGLADLVDRDDVRVIERGRRARLLGESSEAHRIRRETLGQELHRHVPVQVLVARAPDVAHPAGPQAGHELETREPHAGEGRQSMPPERPESTSDGSRDYAPLHLAVKAPILDDGRRPRFSARETLRSHCGMKCQGTYTRESQRRFPHEASHRFRQSPARRPAPGCARRERGRARGSRAHERRRPHGRRQPAARRSGRGARRSDRRGRIDRGAPRLCRPEDARHGPAGPDAGSRLRGRARALPRDRLRAPRRRPRGDAELRRGGGAGRASRPRPARRRVGLRTRLARGEVDDARPGSRARLSHAPGALGRLAGQPRDPHARRRPRGARQREGDGALRHHAEDGGPRRRRDHPRRERSADRRLRRHGQAPRHPAGARRGGAAAGDRARDGRVPFEGDHEPGGRRRIGRGDRALQGARRRGEAPDAALRDGERAQDDAGARPPRDGPRRRMARRPRGQALRRRRARLARGGAARAVLRRPRQPRPAGDAARGAPRSGALRASPTASRPARTRSATAPTASCSTPTRRPSASGRR